MSDTWSEGWPAPAKLNLMLRVLGRRSDGYHNLQTVFQFLDCSDSLDFRLREDGVIRLLNPLPGVVPAEDLTVRAAVLLQQTAEVTQGVDIRMHKTLPIGGGLGGGSSDAATVLVALNHLWSCGFANHDLAALGLRLGADVPIFVHGQAAWAEGIGERLQPISLDEPTYLVVKPPCHSNTAAVFGDEYLTRDSSRITIRAFLAGERPNDCLPVVCKHYPEVKQAIDWLGNFSKPQLTGTGACVFAEFIDEAAAQDVLQQLPKNYQGFVTHGKNRSALLERLASETTK